MGEVPEAGSVQTLEENIRRVIAPNSSPMTYWGTNTYLVGDQDFAVIDPGTDDPGHLAAILEATGEKISHIIVTHSHLDHSTGAQKLAEMTGAQVYSFGAATRGQSELMKRLVANGMPNSGEGVDHSFLPDIQLNDGEFIKGNGWELEVIWTPGHISNHICLALGNVVFSGDHVMEWATSIVSPPDGEVGAFLNSCERLLERSDKVYLPGHGSAVHNPMERTQWLIDHRKEREGQILDVLEKGAYSPKEIVKQIYTDIPSALYGAAERNVFAHLIELCEQDIATSDGEIRSDARYLLVK